MKILALVLGLAVLASQAACTGNKSESAAAVEAYLQALVDKDSARLASLSCAAWEENALLELDSFQAVKASLQDLACVESGTQQDNVLVTCTGKILATYNNEIQELDLSQNTFRVIQEGGEQRMCGFQ